MEESLWTWPADDLLRRTASPDPTPGGGSVAAVAGALGLGLVLMALAVTGRRDDLPTDTAASIDAAQERGEELLKTIRAGADGDVADFRRLMASYAMPRASDGEAEARRTAIREATLQATRGPLRLAQAATDAVALSREVEPVVHSGIVSDVLAGRDLLAGAARAALRTADINLAALERAGAVEADDLRAQRDSLWAQTSDASQAAS